MCSMLIAKGVLYNTPEYRTMLRHGRKVSRNKDWLESLSRAYAAIVAWL